MASLTCPNCGRDNPDFLDNCQFCQTALRREATLSTGDSPTKKNTGELEKALPDWLQDARQQARDAAEEEAAKEATKPKNQKEEPLDLLAGLAFQAESDEEEVPDWLSAINPVKDKQASEPSKPTTPKEETEPSDFFAQFEGSKKEDFDISPTIPLQGEARPEETLPWMSGGATADAGQKDELTDWFSQGTSGPGTAFTFEPEETPASGMDRPSQPPFDSAPSKPAESEDLSWLRDLEAASKGQPPPPAPSGEPQDRAWTSDLGASSSTPEDLSWLDNLGATPTPVSGPASAPESQPEDLSWLSNLGGTPLPNEPAAGSPSSKEEDLDWLKNLGGVPAPSSSEPAPSTPEEDLSWLNTLGGTTPAPAESAQEDLSWLKDFGSTPAEAAPSSSESPPAPSSDDLSWLKDFGATPTPATPSEPSSGPAQEELDWLKDFSTASSGPASTTSPEPTSAQADLDWLKDFGSTPPASTVPTEPASEPAQEDWDWFKDLSATPAAETPASSGPAAAADDLSWLKDFGTASTPSSVAPTTPEESAPVSEEPDWLKDFSETQAPSSTEPAPFTETEVPDWLKDMEAKQSLGPVSPFSPARTAPLSADAAQEIPDWLKSATEAAKSPSLPPLGATARDRSVEKRKPEEVPHPSAQDEPLEQGVFSTPSDSTLSETTLDNQDVDALFAVDMPDWLTQTEATSDEVSGAPAEARPAAAGDELAPVELPSWVQAMRPVEAVMGETAAISADQAPEREGPLAGMRGVIPFAPIGSAQRPKAISLKLQATAEQQAGATLVEQIISGEAVARPLKTSAFISSQSALRWGLAILFWVVLSVIIGFGTQIFPVSSALPVEVSNISNVIFGLPSGAPVLVVMDYEPSLAGEMEAASGAVLDQLVVLRKPLITFVATSPNGVGLVDRLLANTRISQPAAEGGLDYQAGTQYFNAGYLPGGLAGIRGFIEDPTRVIQSLVGRVDRFSSYQSVIILTDQAEAGQIWIEQLTLAKQVGLPTDPALASQQVLVVASGQAGPMLRPYVASQQVAGMLSGLSEAARYEYVNNTRPGLVRSYWDAFGTGLLLAIISIVLGSLWSLFAGIRARRTEAEPG